MVNFVFLFKQWQLIFHWHLAHSSLTLNGFSSFIGLLLFCCPSWKLNCILLLFLGCQQNEGVDFLLGIYQIELLHSLHIQYREKEKKQNSFLNFDTRFCYFIGFSFLGVWDFCHSSMAFLEPWAFKVYEILSLFFFPDLLFYPNYQILDVWFWVYRVIDLKLFRRILLCRVVLTVNGCRP